MSTPANVILITKKATHLFSFGKGGYPSEIELILARSQRILNPVPEGESLGWAETMFRVDACFAYIIDQTTKRIRAFETRPFDWGEERTTEKLLAWSFCLELNLRDKSTGLRPPAGWRFQPVAEVGQPVQGLREVARHRNKLYDGLEPLLTAWPDLSRAEQQASLAAIVPITGLKFDRGIDPLRQEDFTPILIMPTGIQGYKHSPTGTKAEIIPFAALSDQQLHNCYTHWYRQGE